MSRKKPDRPFDPSRKQPDRPPFETKVHPDGAMGTPGPVVEFDRSHPISIGVVRMDTKEAVGLGLGEGAGEGEGCMVIAVPNDVALELAENLLSQVGENTGREFMLMTLKGPYRWDTLNGRRQEETSTGPTSSKSSGNRDASPSSDGKSKPTGGS